MASSTPAAVTLPIPRIPYICVEIPGHVEGETGAQKILECLGGETALTEASLSPRQIPLVLRLDPKDRYSKFVSATFNPIHQLVTKRTERKSGKIEYTILGIGIQHYGFEHLMDFFIAPPVEARLKRNIEEAMDETLIEPFFMPPPMFTRPTAQFVYKYEENPFSRTAKYFKKTDLTSANSEYLQSDSANVASSKSLEELKNTETPHDIATALLMPADSSDTGAASSHIKAESETVKLDPHRGKMNEEALNLVWKYSDADVPSHCLPFAMKVQTEPKLLAILVNLFDWRPIWLRSSIEEYIPSQYTQWKKKNAFAKVCYLISDGPWRGCLCRLAYNPKLHSESAIYQSIDFRDPYFRTTNWRTTQHPSTINVNTSSAAVNAQGVAMDMSQMGSFLDTSAFETKFEAIRSDQAFLNYMHHVDSDPLAYLDLSKDCLDEAAIGSVDAASIQSNATAADYPQSKEKEEGETKKAEVDHIQKSKAETFTVFKPSAEVHFRIPPVRHSQMYQLVDIDDPSVKKVLAEASIMAFCSRETGWFSKEVLVKIRDIMTVKCKLMREPTLPKQSL